MRGRTRWRPGSLGFIVPEGGAQLGLWGGVVGLAVDNIHRQAWCLAGLKSSPTGKAWKLPWNSKLTGLEIHVRLFMALSF